MGCSVFHVGKYYVSFKRGVEDFKKDITITVNKVFESNSLRILLSDEDDPMFLFTFNITKSDYEDLKKQQGLLIDFDNFSSQFVRLLQQCAANNMFLIMEQKNPLQYCFEIVEHNEFKRLIHLSLKTGPASDADIKHHMANSIVSYKEALNALKKSSSNNEILWNDKHTHLEHKIRDLTLALAKMEEEKLRQETEFRETLRRETERLKDEHLQFQKNNELTSKSQINMMQEKINKKDRQIEEFIMQDRQLKENISLLENQLSEKSQRMMLLEKEVQKSHIEAVTSKARITVLERDILDKEKIIHQIETKCNGLEKTLSENSFEIKNLNNTIQHLKKEKVSLEERIAISETLANKNNEAAHATSEQLLKANQIISKLNTDLIEMKEKLLCRTAIALEQENVIENNAKEIESLKSEVNGSKQQMEELKIELNNLKEKFNDSEKALKDRDETIKNNNLVIQWLHKKVEENCLTTNSRKSVQREGFSSTSSAPYLLNRDDPIENLHEISDSTPDFYATSRMSDVNETQKEEMYNENVRTGLDPKYLRPALDKQDQMKIHNRGTNSANASNKGKENKEVVLPKVNYREKKIAQKNDRPKSVSYRTTPISAYFP